MAATRKKSASYDGFTEEERSAMKEHAKELKASRGEEEDEAAQLAKIAELPDEERELAERISAIVKENAPELTPKTWYGMPGWAKNGKVVVFFQYASKFKARYNELGFNETAALDDGDMWPVAYALNELTPAVEKQITALVRKAAG